MNIITFHSHDFRFLSMQIAAFRHFAKVDSFVVVQGPHGANPATSAGDVRLRDGVADQLGIETIDAPASIAGLPFPIRFRELMAWAGQSFTGDRIVCHGDLFPLAPFTLDTLLLGKPTAGRTHASGHPALTWLAARDGACIPRGDRIADGSAFTRWDATRRPGLGFEICPPVFIHADKLSASHATGFAEQFDAKIHAIALELRVVGVTWPDLGELSEPIAGLPDHAPWFPKPAPQGLPVQAIPDDYDPATGWRLDSQGNAGCGCAE